MPLSLTFLLCFPSSTNLFPRVPFIPSFPPIPFRYSLFLTSNFLCFSLSYCLFYSIVSNLILITSKSLETVILASIHSHARPSSSKSEHYKLHENDPTYAWRLLVIRKCKFTVTLRYRRLFTICIAQCELVNCNMLSSRLSINLAIQPTPADKHIQASCD